MPLHLLPKKSWNVYNAANIERVRRDEAAARAAEAAAEERMQQADAARRLAILRGEEPPPLPAEEESAVDPAAGALVRGAGRDRMAAERRKRKRHGEDDTDFEMRVARERAAEVAEVKRRDGVPAELAAIMDPQGDEMPQPRGVDEVRGGKSATRERAANPGLKDALGIEENPWFVKALKPGEVNEVPGKDAWGNEDPGRKVRDAVRLDKSDPLAMMKQGAAKVREIERERKRELEERERELKMLRKEERRREKRRKREGRHREEADELEGFSLDAPATEDDGARSESPHRNRHHPNDKRWNDGRSRPDEDRRHRPDRRESDRHRHRHRHRSREDRGSNS